MRWIGLVFGLLLFSGAAPFAHGAESPTPQACKPGPDGQIDYAACASAAPANSIVRKFALINLGTQAFMAGDYAKAVAYYDEAQPPGKSERLYSDAGLHAFRGAAYDHVGRSAEALVDAKTAVGILAGDPSIPVPREVREATVDQELVYALALPILYRAKAPEFPAAFAAYNRLPEADWYSLARKAALLEELDDLPGSLEAGAKVVALQPENPAVLNNHCFALTRAGRAREALGFCERALVLAPDAAAVHDSYAEALAGAGQCSRARSEREAASQMDPSSANYKKPVACTDQP